VDRDTAVRRLNAAISREHNSVSEYVLHSSAYTTPADDAAMAAFQRIRDAQAATASWLTTRLREDFGAGPTLQAFEYWKRDLNYLSVPYLVRFAVDHFAKVAGEYEAALAEAGDDERLKPIFARLRDEAKAHGALLEKHLPKA
jgi:hypothetical protein